MMNKTSVVVVVSVLGVLVAVVALPALLMQGNKASAEGSMKKMMADAHLPMTTQELYPAPTVPDNENAFMLIDQIQVASKKPGMVEVKAPVRGAEWDVQELRKSVNAKQEMLALAEQAASRPDWVPLRKGDGPNILFPEFATVKSAVKALAERIRVRTADGDYKGAVQDSESALKLGDLVRKEPILIGGLVSIASHAIAYNVMAESASSVRHDKAAMDALVTAAERPLDNDFRHLFLGEATMSYYMATHRFNWNDYGMDGTSDSPEAKLKYAKMELDRPYWGPVLVKGWADYLEQAKKHPSDIDANELALDKLAKLADSKDDRLGAIVVMFPVFSQAFDAYRKEVAQHDILCISLKAMRDGQSPDVQGTKDPFSGKPYRVARLNGGWKVYSYGTDRRDDNGTYTFGTVNEDSHKNDIVFTWDGKKSSLKGR